MVGREARILLIFENKLSRHQTEEIGKLGPGKISMLNLFTTTANRQGKIT